MHVVEQFAAFAERLRSRPLPEEVLHHAKRALIDWHAAAYPGALAAPATLLDKSLSEELDRGGSRLFLGPKATARAAGPVNRSPAPPPGVGHILSRRAPPPG